MPFITSFTSLLAAASLAASVAAHGSHGLTHEHLHRRTVIDSGDNGIGDDEIHPRLEISYIAANRPEQWSLIIQTMVEYQAMDASNLTGYFQIAGIHGVPMISYDGVEECADCSGAYGYCTHDSVLFPAWHRAYLALFEQGFLDVALTVANSYPEGTKRQAMLTAQSTLRFPFWDWAANPPSGASLVPTYISDAKVTIDGPDGEETIDNPLYVYEIPSSELSAMYYSPFTTWPETLRYPNTDSADATSDDTSMVSAFSSIASTLQDQVYSLLSTCDDYLEFSNDDSGSSSAGCSNSLEGIHNTVHTTSGGDGSSSVSGGHMTYLPVAGFDPVFWLHHANVDRLFALWQTAHPDSYGASQVAPHNTWTIAEGTTQDADSDLTPFRKTSTDFWTTNDVEDWASTFKYTYPEFTTTDGSKASIVALINELYGTDANLTQTSISERVDSTSDASSSSSSSSSSATASSTKASTFSSTKTTRSSTTSLSNPIGGFVSSVLGSVGSLLTGSDSASLSQATTSASYASLSGGWNVSTATSAGTYATASTSPSFTTSNGSTWEYVCNIHTPRYTLNGSYTVYIFDGAPTSDNCADWLSESGLIGTMGVLAGGGDMGAAQGLIVAGSVPLTRHLQKQVTAGKIESMSDEYCTPYLTENLVWKVSKQGEEVDISSIDGFKAYSFQSVSSPATADTLPVWGDFVSQPDVTLGKIGGAVADEYAKVAGAVASLTGLISGYGSATSATETAKPTTTVVVTKTKTVCPCTDTGLASY